VFRALTGLATGSLRTPNVHSEIVASLAISNNIAEAYRRFGINPDSKDVLVVKVTSTETGPTADDVWAHLAKHVEGEAVALTEENVAGRADWQKVRKYYKLNGLAWLDALPEERRRQESEMIILSSMALRGV
jgi:EKC/KEOPS complex subunit CGI121/TPRKB